MRLLAWRETPRKGLQQLKYREPYACARDCKTKTGWSHARRVARGCTRPDLPPVSWDVSVSELLSPGSGMASSELYMGRDPDPTLAGTEDVGLLDPAHPTEPSADGCPGGWYRTSYASSVLRYARRRVEGGARVENGLLKAVDDQTWAAVLELEREQERWHGHAAQRGDEIRAAARKSAATKGKGSRGR